MKRSFKPAKLVAVNAAFGPMAWSCAPNSSVANAQRFCKTSN